MHSFQINLVNGHAIIESGENIILVDTGSPRTYHVSDVLTFCSEEHRCSHRTKEILEMGRLTPDEAFRFIGARITTLLGTDILSKYRVLIDYKNRAMRFSRNDIAFNGATKRLSSFFGVPIVELEARGETLRFFLDTGARLSYLSADLTVGLESVGEDEDFYPGLGAFRAPRYVVPVKLDDCEFNATFGNLPPLLEMTLEFAGAKGIIGYDFFVQFKVLLDLANGILKYERNSA